MTASEKIRLLMSEATEQIIAVMEQWTPEQRTALSEATKKSAAIFDEFRVLYPGKKRGVQTEFGNFKKKVKDWKEVLQLLLPALKNQIHWREIDIKKQVFTPEWKNLQTWINQRCWEMERGTAAPPIKNKFQSPTNPVYEFLKIKHPDPPKPKNDTSVPTIEEMIERDIEDVREHKDLFSMEQNIVPVIAGIKFEKLWKTKRWRPTKEQVEKFHAEACDHFIRLLKGDSTKVNNRAAANHLEKTREFTDEHKAKIGVIAETLAYIHYLKIQTA
jgi:hypothetical protein